MLRGFARHSLRTSSFSRVSNISSRKFSVNDASNSLVSLDILRFMFFLIVNEKGDDVMKLGKLNHVAIAVPDLNSSVNLYQNILGGKCSEAMDLPEHGVTTVFVDLGNTKIELLGLLGEGSPIKNFLEKNPAGGIHHICIEVRK